MNNSSASHLPPYGTPYHCTHRRRNSLDRWNGVFFKIRFQPIHRGSLFETKTLFYLCHYDFVDCRRRHRSWSTYRRHGRNDRFWRTHEGSHSGLRAAHRCRFAGDFAGLAGAVFKNPKARGRHVSYSLRSRSGNHGFSGIAQCPVGSGNHSARRFGAGANDFKNLQADWKRRFSTGRR